MEPQDDEAEMMRLLREIRMSEMLARGTGQIFVNGHYLGDCEGAALRINDPEWPEVVLEDILDAEVIGDE